MDRLLQEPQAPVPQCQAVEETFLDRKVLDQRFDAKQRRGESAHRRPSTTQATA